MHSEWLHAAETPASTPVLPQTCRVDHQDCHLNPSHLKTKIIVCMKAAEFIRTGAVFGAQWPHVAPLAQNPGSLICCRYGFSSTESSEEFKQRPAAYIKVATDVLLKHPYLIPTAACTDAQVPPLLSDVLNMGYSMLRLDYGTQTPTHFVESHIDPKCVSNLQRSPTSCRASSFSLPARHQRHQLIHSPPAVTSGTNGCYEGRLLLWQTCRPS
jgi:hypothetical protein